MLDAYIIEEIKKHEEERRRREENGRPRLHIEIPSNDDRDPDEPPEEGEDRDEGTVIRIDL